MAIVSEEPHSMYEEPAQKKTNLKIKRISEVITALHKCKHKSKKKKSVKKEKPKCDEVQVGGLHMKNKMNGEDFSGKSVVPENYDPDLNALESTKKKDKPKHLKKKKQKNISSEQVTQDHEEDQGVSINKMSQGISERMPHQFKRKSKKKKSAEKKERHECDEVQGGSLPLKNEVKRRDFSEKSEVPELNALGKKRKDKPKKVKKKKHKDISSKLITQDHEEDQRVSTNKMSMVISAAKDLEPVPKIKKKKDKVTKRKKEKLYQEKEGKCTSLKEISGRMPIGEAQDSEMKWDKKKSKKAARSGDVMATVDGVLGTNKQKDASKEMKRKKRKRHEIDVTDETSALKTKKKKVVVEEELDCDIVDILSMKKGHEELPTDQVTKYGQWSTASFENADQQMKFFRLMGGFKKSSQPASLSPVEKEKANMALDKTGEQRLQQGLQTEFDKAQNLKQHRGSGLGFQPAANKIFHINKNASRSIKFD